MDSRRIHFSFIIILTMTTAEHSCTGADATNNKDAILVPVVEVSTKSIKEVNHPQHHLHHDHQRHHHHSKPEQAILLHELPHKIIIEEEEYDGNVEDALPPPMTIIKEKESYFHPPIEKIPYGPSLPPSSPILVRLVPPNVRRKHDSSIPDLLAVLAPLAAIPLIGSLAVSSFTTMLTLTGLGKRRRKRDLGLHDKVLHFLNSSGQNFELNGLNSNHSFNHNMGSSQNNFRNMTINNRTMIPISELFQLDIVQQYLRQSGRPDHNDEIIASYLACRGMFSPGNNCLERLACHYADMQSGRLRPLERDVAALIIYSLLRNTHIDSSFKRRLQRAALFGYDHNTSSSSSFTFSTGSSSAEPSFVSICDREFPCPRSEVP